MKFKCIIIDDESIARELLTQYISKIPELELLISCSNALDAMQYIHRGEVDLLFLDIQMPDITGIDFLKILDNPPKVILTTAYSEYAIESYQYGVVDYLLKPIEFDRFYKAVNKLFTQLSLSPSSSSAAMMEEQSKTKQPYFFVKADNKIVKINYTDIQYISSKGAYVQIVLSSGKKIMTLQSMNKMEEILPSEHFFRIHRSHIINIPHVTTIEGYMIQLGEQVKINISKNKKEDFLRHIDKYSY